LPCQVEGLKVGDKVRFTLFGHHSEYELDGHARQAANPDATWRETTITKIFAAGTSTPIDPRQRPRAYACMYVDFGSNSSISVSISEGDEHLVPLEG